MSAEVATHYCGRCLTTFQSDPTTCPNLACGSSQPETGWGNVLREGDLLDRHYRVERSLAVGGAGITYLARQVDEKGEPAGERVAIKVLYVDRAQGGFLRRLSIEAQILQDLAHAHIVRLRGFVQRAGQEPYLVTLFEEGGSLTSHVERSGPLSPAVAAAMMRQVLLALDVAHQRGVVHRDLKPDNVLLEKVVGTAEVPHLRVADFGIAKVAGGGENLTRVGGFVGTPEFAAPEQFEGKPPSAATDIYAAGGLLVYLLTGHPPFTFSSRRDLTTTYDELVKQLPPAIERYGIRAAPDELALIRNVVTHTLVADPQERWTVSRILKELAPLVGSHTGEVSLNVTAAETLADPGMYGDSLTNTPEPRRVPSAPPPLPPGVKRPIAPPVSIPAPVSAPTPIPVPVPVPVEEKEPEREEERDEEDITDKEPPVVEVEPQPHRSRARLAGCMGLSVVGALAAGGAGLVVIGVVLVAVGWSSGWFLGSGPSPVPASAPAHVPAAPAPVAAIANPELVARFERAPALPEADTLQVQRAARGVTNAIARRCGDGAQVLAQVLVDKSGQALHAKVDTAQSRLGSVQPSCVESGLLHVKVPNGVSREGRAAVSLRLK